MSAPSTRDYLAASEAAYGESQPGYAESHFIITAASNPSQSTLLSDAGYFIQEEGINNWKPIAVSYKPQDGMYSVAYQTDQNTIIVAFEGTVPNKSRYGINTIVDDNSIIEKQTPSSLFADDAAFMTSVIQQANELGIGENSIFLTGHSLGGAEAEYVSSLTGLAGATFGAPGLPGYNNGGANKNFIDYVDYGDPIGNYASNEPATLFGESIAPSSGEDHVGIVQPVGQSSNTEVLRQSSYDGALLLHFGTYVDDYHSRASYAKDLDVVGLNTLDSDTPKNAVAPDDIISAIDAGLGISGKRDLTTLHANSLEMAGTRDFKVDLDDQDHTITIDQKSDIEAPVLGLSGDAGTYTIDTTPNGQSVNTEMFVDGDNGNIIQLVTDNNPLSRQEDIGFQSVSNDILVIQRPRLYNGTISNFESGDVVDLSNVNALSAALRSGDTLSIQTASGTAISLQLANQNYSGDLFETYSDGNGGTDIGIATVSASANTPTVSEDAGSEQFTLMRSGDTSQAATVYVSTTDGSTVAGESANAGNINPFVYQPVTFAAGSSTAQVGVTVNDLGLYDGITNTYGIQVTTDQSQANVLATGQFSIINNDPAPTISISPTDPTVSESASSEDFTLTRSGNASQAETVYVSTTDGSTVAGENVNSGAFNPFVYQPVTFAAGSSMAQVGVGINDLGLNDGSTNTYGIQVTADQSQGKLLAANQFSIVNNDNPSSKSFAYQGLPLNISDLNIPNDPLLGTTVSAEVDIANYTQGFSGTIGSEAGSKPYIYSAELYGDGYSGAALNPSVTLVGGQIQNWNLQYYKPDGDTPAEIITYNEPGLTSDYIGINGGNNTFGGDTTHNAGKWKELS